MLYIIYIYLLHIIYIYIYIIYIYIYIYIYIIFIIKLKTFLISCICYVLENGKKIQNDRNGACRKMPLCIYLVSC